MRIDESSFRWPDGVQFAGRDGDNIRMRVSMPADKDGLLGRQCPDCSQLFRVDAGVYEALPDELQMWCVYCGHRTGHGEFITQQQLERAKQAAGAWAVQALQQTFNRRSRSSFVPKPLPGISEEALIRIRTCATCALPYAVFGEHRYCPVCGPLDPGVVALDALAAETARLDALSQLPQDAAAVLRESGALTRLWVDTLENLVGIVEAFAKAQFNSAVPDAAARTKSKGGNVFQRLDDFADLFVDAGYPDLRTIVGAAVWGRMLQVWAIRHLFTHNDGVIDAKYAARVPVGAAKIGQRATVTEAACRQAIADVQVLTAAVSGFIAP